MVTSNTFNNIVTGIDSGLDKLSRLGKVSTKMYITQIKVTSSGNESVEDGYVTYSIYCEQFDEEAVIQVEKEFAKQITEGWKYRATRTIDVGTEDTERAVYESVFNGEVDGMSISSIDSSIVEEIDGIVVDKIETIDTSNKLIYILKLCIESENRTMYITAYADEKIFNSNEVGDTLRVLKKEAKTGFDTVLIDYKLG